MPARLERQPVRGGRDLGGRLGAVVVLGVEELARLPIVGAAVSAPEGSITLRMGGAGVGAAAKLTPLTTSVFVTAGIGGGRPLTFILSLGRRHETIVVRALMDPSLHDKVVKPESERDQIKRRRLSLFIVLDSSVPSLPVPVVETDLAVVMVWATVGEIFWRLMCLRLTWTAMIESILVKVGLCGKISDDDPAPPI